MISAIVLTHNSARTLEATLQSVSWCDEIIVIDDCSTDETGIIARRYSSKFFRRALRDDFSAQRNYGIECASGEWILFVDADEIITSALKAEIQEAVKHSTIDGYYLKRQDTMWGRTLSYGETSSVRLMRLARKGAGKWVRPVHEVWDVHGYTQTLTHPILHSPHPDVRRFLVDIEDYSTTNAEYLYEQNVRVHGLMILAYPIAKFVQNYIVRQGFRDKTAGMVIALMMSFHSFLTRAKLWVLWQRGV